MRTVYMKKVAWFLCTKIMEIAGGKKIRELARCGDSVVLHISRREVLLLQLILLRSSTSLRWRGCVAVPSELWRTMPWRGRALPRSWPPSYTPRRGRRGGCWMTSSSGSADRRPSRWKPISISSSRGWSLKAGRCSSRPGRTTSFSAPTWRLLCGKICLPWWHSGTCRCWTRTGRVSLPQSFWGCWPTSRTSPTPPRSSGVWLAQDDLAAAVSPGVLHLPVRKAGASKVSHSKLAI